jgi:ATP-binding cassette subfamily F protein uup
LLEDPTLYSRDPRTFDATMKKLDILRAELETGELEWLELEEKKAALG